MLNAELLKRVVALALVCGCVSLARPTDEQILDQAKTLLNVTGGDLVALDVPMDPPGTDFFVDVPIDGLWYTATLRTHSNRAPGYILQVQQADGTYVQAEPGMVRTLRGELAEAPGALVSGSLMEEGLWLMVEFPDGERFWVEPLAKRIKDTELTDHIVYRDSQVLGSNGTCKLLGEIAGIDRSQMEPPSGDAEGGVAGGGGVYIAQLAVDTDFQYYQDYNNVNSVENQIENIINTMNNQYEFHVQITHLITSITVRTSEPDGYSASNSAETILNELTNMWNGNAFPGIQRDVVELFSGKNFSGSTIGIAWLGSVCKALRYNAVESNCGGCNAFACKTDLSAHELGHNWDAGHCCPGTTMNSSLQCANTFGNTSKNQIIAYRNSITSCLDLGETLARIIISGPTVVNEGATAQYTAIAEYNPGDDIVVTNQVQWSVNPPSAGTINSNGLFTAAQVNQNTSAQIVGFFSDGEDEDTDVHPITVIDLTPPPDPRKVVVTATPSVNPATLCDGDTFDVSLSLASQGGSIEDVRLLQFDSTLSTAMTINSVTWSFSNLVSPSLYFLTTTPDVFVAAYTALSSAPGFIVNLTAAPQQVATFSVTFNGGSGAVDICGLLNPPTGDEGIRFSAGFENLLEFTTAEGNVLCAAIPLVEGGTNCSLSIVSSIPPTDTIDARQPSNPDGSSPAGISTVELTFDGDADGLTIADFEITEDGADGIPPTITAVVLIDTDSVMLFLSEPIDTVAWTTITHTESGSSVNLAFLPGDVNGDGTSAVPDVLALIDDLNGITDLSIYSTDIDRSGAAGAPDVLREIDLLNGAGVYPVYNGVSLP